MDPKLAAIIIHDIKNSLGVLEGELRRLSDDVPRVQQAHVTCLALQEKLIAFLTLYKADSQGLRAQVEAVSPLDFLDALVREHGMSAAGDIALRVDETDMPVIGFFDEHLVALALEAALQNASRFARSDRAGLPQTSGRRRDLHGARRWPRHRHPGKEAFHRPGHGPVQCHCHCPQQGDPARRSAPVQSS
jgi:signal transduction histidine kinase